jgi:glycosyltransferase involved in cell wall biosynthesis
MKICFLTNELSRLHGWGSYSVDLILALQKYGVEPVILTEKSANNIKLPGAEVFSVLRPSDQYLKCPLNSYLDYLKLKKTLPKCDFVHSLIEPMSMLAGLISPNKYFVTLHGSYALEPISDFWSGHFFRRAYAGSAGLLAISRYTESALKDKVPGAKIFVVNNGVNIERFPLMQRDYRSRIILGVGAIKIRKGYHVVIEAMAEIVGQFPDAQYLIAGGSMDAAYKKQLEDLIEKYNLKNNVKLLGRVTDQNLMELYKSASIFALTPLNFNEHFEGFGLVYLEAGATGLPVIGSLNCGAEDAIIDGLSGFLVAQNNPQELAKKIKLLLSNPELCRELGGNGRKHTEQLNWDNVAKKVLEIYAKS